MAPEYAPALEGLEGFGHIQVLWWFSGCDDPESRGRRREDAPYKRGPATLGTFATRSPLRPNPIALSTLQVTRLDSGRATIWVAYADADDGSPVLDIKPYTLSVDRVEAPAVPAWCAHWPRSVEQSGSFDWLAEFNL